MTRTAILIPTTWDYRPCEARKCFAVVADNKMYPNYWARRHIGKVRQVVEVDTPDGKIYLDNEDGSGWMKVTSSPCAGYRELLVSSIVQYAE
jgi:hypothetical protein